MKNRLFSKFSILLLVMLVAAMALTGCGQPAANNAATTNTDAAQATDTAAATDANTSLGEGSHAFTFVVKDADGNITTFQIQSNATTVGEALASLDLISGDQTEFGLYVKNVNGIVADYDVDQTYWAFYIDGEYASTGVDATDIVDGSTYMFAVEK